MQTDCKWPKRLTIPLAPFPGCRSLSRQAPSKCSVPLFLRSPQFGVTSMGSPRFVPICSDFSAFSVFFCFLPISICAFLLFWNTPICSDLLRFLPTCSHLFPGTTPLLPTPFASCTLSSLREWPSGGSRLASFTSLWNKQQIVRSADLCVRTSAPHCPGCVTFPKHMLTQFSM